MLFVGSFVEYAPIFLSFFFGKYWPVDGLLRPKLVAYKRKNKIKKIVLSDGVHI